MLPKIYIRDYHYELPDERIAKFPLSPRDTSKLLVYRHGEISQSTFSKLSDYLPSGVLLVFNDTKVIPARLHFQKSSGAQIEIFCLEPCEPANYEQSLQATSSCSWNCIVGNLKRWKDEDLKLNFKHNEQDNALIARKINAQNDSIEIQFSWTAPDCTFAQLLELCGEIPLPPYLNRKSQASDYETYQTIYARQKGSVAAPTAGLHFTQNVFNSLKNNGIQTDNITLHVGAGTFKPVKTTTANEHVMHIEKFMVRLDLLENLQKNLGKIYAVGTTSARTLESIYYLGYKLLKENTLHNIVEQWEPYQDKEEIAAAEIIDNFVDYLKTNNITQFEAGTRLMIAPNYGYKLVAGLITNFHQPQSTLLLLVSAMIGEDWKKVYQYALEHDFRFLSYGDSSIIMN